MSDNSNNPEELSIEEEAEETCRLIRGETISPLSWLFPASNPCVSCVLFSGGHPQLMAPYCPRVIERMAAGAEPEGSQEE